jgi:tetratricopeptide (TPR) repeat protein
MSQAHQPSDRPAALPLAELFTRYLQRQADAQAQGLGFAEPSGEVTPYEAVPVQPVDPALAFRETLEVRRFFPVAARGSWAAPPDWPAVVAAHEPEVSVAFCLGNFPQLVRNLHPLLADSPSAVRVNVGRPVSVPALLDWTEKAREPHARLLAAGALRLARQFELAGKLLSQVTDKAWQALRANEEASLAWHRGQTEDAFRMWQAQESSLPVLFNRGMAALFLGQTGAAREALEQAAAGLPETSSWHHLARLYRTLAETRA